MESKDQASPAESKDAELSKEVGLDIVSAEELCQPL